MARTAGFTDRSLTDKRFKLSGDLDKKGPVVLIAGGEVSDLTDTAEHPPGTVVCLDSDDGKCYRADSVNGGDRNAAAEVASLEAADDDWEDGEEITITVHYPDGTVVEDVIAAGAEDDTTAEFVALINGRQALEGHVVASGSNGNPLTITTVKKGDVKLKVTSTVASAFGAAGQEDRGTEAKYFVTEHWAYLKEGNVDRDYHVPTLRAGDFDTSELSGLTDEARAYLTRMGSQFD